MVKTHEYVIEQLTKKAMNLLSRPNEVRFFVINGCDHYMCWIDKEHVAFGSGEIEVVVVDNMSEQEINSLFAKYINSSYSDKIDYNFARQIKTISKLKEESPWFNIWKDE